MPVVRPTRGTTEVAAPVNIPLNHTVPRPHSADLSGLGDVTAAIAERADRQDELALKDAVNRAKAAATDSVFNPKTGIMSFEGKEAVDNEPNVLIGLGERLDEIRGELPERLHKRYDVASYPHLANTLLSGKQYVGQQEQNYSDQLDNTAIAIAEESVLEIPTVSNFYEATKTITTTVDNLNPGVADKVLDQMTLEKTSSAFTPSILNLVQNNRLGEAEVLLETFRENLTEEDQDKIEVKIKGQEILNTANDTVDSYVAAGMTLGEQYETADKIKDGALRKAVDDAISTKATQDDKARSRAEQLKKEARDELMNAGMDYIISGGDIAKWPRFNDLGGVDKSKLLNAARRTPSSRSDPRLLGDIRELIAIGDFEGARDLAIKDGDQLTDADYNSINKSVSEGLVSPEYVLSKDANDFLYNLFRDTKPTSKQWESLQKVLTTEVLKNNSVFDPGDQEFIKRANTALANAWSSMRVPKGEDEVVGTTLSDAKVAEVAVQNYISESGKDVEDFSRAERLHYGRLIEGELDYARVNYNYTDADVRDYAEVLMTRMKNGDPLIDTPPGEAGIYDPAIDILHRIGVKVSKESVADAVDILTSKTPRGRSVVKKFKLENYDNFTEDEKGEVKKQFGIAFLNSRQTTDLVTKIPGQIGNQNTQVNRNRVVGVLVHMYNVGEYLPGTDTGTDAFYKKFLSYYNARQPDL